jgi:phosphate uptake regulator
MVFKFFKGKASARIASIEAKTTAMLAADGLEFDLAVSALLGNVDPTSVNDQVRSTDRRVNQLEREVRREILVHASVFGGIDSPTVLAYMSIVKDIERVGDYAKNLLDLAIDGANLSLAPNADHWRRLTAEVSAYITAVDEAFHARDTARARTLRVQGDRLLDHFDERVSALIKEDPPSAQAVARALAHRYLKRVVAHLMNVLSAVIMPLDRLDYYDEDPEDRRED